MKGNFQGLIMILVVIGWSIPSLASDDTDGMNIFEQKCKMCHAIDRKKIGPAVLNMSSDEDLLRMRITDGYKRMPKFGTRLSKESIDALVVFIQSHSAEVPNNNSEGY